jgi:xylulokinase
MYVGIDVGTQSAKVYILEYATEPIAHASAPIPQGEHFSTPEGYYCHEQDPQQWFEAVVKALKNAIRQTKRIGHNPRDIKGILMCGTSGTMLCLDTENQPLLNAIMYDDGRAVVQAEKINKVARDHCAKFGYHFSASFGLPKLLWIQENRPEIWSRTAKAIHASDYIVGKFTGEYGISDHSNALKTGFDLIANAWPPFLADLPQFDSLKLPQVLTPGDFIANTTPELESLTGVPAGTAVFAGVTDSTASVLSAGAVACGDIYSVLGSTIVEKTVSSQILKDSEGRVYSHRMPDQNWLVGGASNVGALILKSKFSTLQAATFNETAMSHCPTDQICYPLLHTGERFPFIHPTFPGFNLPTGSNMRDFVVILEGLCFTERMMLDVFTEIGQTLGNYIYSVGGGIMLSSWMQLRAAILNKEILVPKYPEAAYGCAILAACVHDQQCDLVKACSDIVEITQKYTPDVSLGDKYDLIYKKFKEKVRDFTGKKNTK